MTVATCEFDAESRERLWAYFCEVGAKLAKEYDILPGELVNSRRKGGAISGAREEFVGIWRKRVGQRRICQPHQIFMSKSPWEARVFAEEEGLPWGWQPFSFPNLSRVLGFDHTALVLAEQRRRARVRDETSTRSK